VEYDNHGNNTVAKLTGLQYCVAKLTGVQYGVEPCAVTITPGHM